MKTSIILLILLNLTLLALTATTAAAQPASASRRVVLLAPAIDHGTPQPPVAAAASNGEPFIKKMRFQVPENARLGSTMKLSCVYELSGASLHAMKLFKDDKEFYRYTPAIQQLSGGGAGAGDEQRIAFNSPGIKVDLARSSEQDIWIKFLDKRAAGTYKCQVSIEDTFKSISAEKRLDVSERVRTVPTGAAATSWLGSPSSSSSSSSAAHQQQRHAVQQQQSQKSKVPVSFMQQQQQQQAATSGSNRLQDSYVLSLVGAILIMITMISRRHPQQEAQSTIKSSSSAGSSSSRLRWRLLWLRILQLQRRRQQLELQQR